LFCRCVSSRLYLRSAHWPCLSRFVQLGIVHQLGERTRALPVDFIMQWTAFGNQLDRCHPSLNTHVNPNINHTPLDATSSGHHLAPTSFHQEAHQSGPPPPSSARTPSPRLTEQRPTSPDWASAGQDHRVPPTPTPSTAPPMGVSTIQATGHLSPRALAGGSIAGGRVASPIFSSTAAAPPPTTRSSHMGGVESVGTLSPIPSPRGPITHATVRRHVTTFLACLILFRFMLLRSDAELPHVSLWMR
jgi:hypothetical protein